MNTYHHITRSCTPICPNDPCHCFDLFRKTQLEKNNQRYRLQTAANTPAIMRFLKSRDNSTAPKSPSTPGRVHKAVKPKYEFEFEDPSGEEDNYPDDLKLERDIDTNLLLARLRSRATKQQECRPTMRSENEDPNANELFQDVPGYKEGLRSEDQKKRPTPYEYPPDKHVRGGPTRRVEGDDPAADELLAGASQRQGPTQSRESSVPVPTVNEEDLAIRLAREMRDLRLPGRNREKGEDTAADALFKTSERP